VTLLFKFLPAITVLALLFGVISSLYMFRARSMRGLAARWAFQYVGPLAPNFWGFRSFPKTRLSLPVSFPRAGYPAGEIRQVWNVIEGQQNGVSVLVFDSVLGAGRGVYCTVIACQTKQNPFGRDTSPGRVIQSGGWTVLCRVRYLQIPWTMGTQRLDNEMNKLRVGSL
jgi:hypothetical protein